MKNHIFLSLQPNWFFCMTWTILIICFKLPTATTCLSFYPSLHTKCLDPILQCRIYTNNHTNTFERKEKLFSRSRISNLELFVRHALHEPAPASKPLRPPFRQQEIKLLPPSFAKKNWGEANKTCLPIWLQAKVEWIHKNWKMQKYWADSEPRHSTDFRTIFRTVIGWFVLREIGQMYFTENGGSFGTL